ncbi:glutathione S-transferase family protein [Novosphingobium lentum]|uniref:glutathione S-transferase family protein n=1 Tax=Novosphingobium lentum TaxID=145287 RepID=UPI00082EC4F6|nr:glutathione S-transferase family protein [Novosphingobium lentum]
MTSALRLHGYPVSNYFNIARAALIEKRLVHDIVTARAAQDDAFLAMNPMGKIPVLESPDGWISETVAITEYLDDRFPDHSLRHADLADRATARQIVNIVQMYLEAPIRSLFPGVFANGANDQRTVDSVAATLDRSTRALRMLCRSDPFLVGSAISQADLFAFYNFDIAERVGHFVYGRSVIAEAGLAAWFNGMAKRDSSRLIMADFELHFRQYLADHDAPYRAPPPFLSGQQTHA